MKTKKIVQWIVFVLSFLIVVGGVGWLIGFVFAFNPMSLLLSGAWGWVGGYAFGKVWVELAELGWFL